MVVVPRWPAFSTELGSIPGVTLRGDTMNTEIARIARHALPPAIAYAVAKGWIPADLQQPVIELGLAAAAVLAGIWASRKRDAARG